MKPLFATGIGLALLGWVAVAPAAELPDVHLKVIGGLGTTSQYINHEEPFWTKRLAADSGGHVTAEVSPFDASGIHGSEVMQMMRLGVIGFGTTSLSLIASDDPEAAAVDLVGLNPDIATLRRNVDAYRGQLAEVLRQRYGIELLAIFTYPAQVLFCNHAISRLSDLKGLRVRTAGPIHTEFVEALGGIGITIPYSRVADALRKHVADCAITGTMSGYSLKLYQVASHIDAMTLSWGPNILAASGPVWQRLAPAVRAFLRKELARLEDEIWTAAARETSEGFACNTSGPCPAGPPGHMTLVPVRPEDIALTRHVLASVILPDFAERCGEECVVAWNHTIGRNVGLLAPAD